jgi:7,8-dihydroneopterin aldolase/epimerase/oxygenase
MDCFDVPSHTRFPTFWSTSDAAVQQASSGRAIKSRTRAPMDVVYIEGLTASTVIGIDASEQHVAQPVRMSLAIGVPVIDACTTDRIEDTIDYAAVRDALHKLLATHRVQLLEALAEKIAQLLISDFGAHWVSVSLSKPAKFDDVAAVGVLIERTRPTPRDHRITTALLAQGFIPD